MKQQEIYWRQRAKTDWLKIGDKNSKFFHQSASSRRRRNAFQQLQRDDGSWASWGNGLEGLIQDFYSNLFQSDGSDGELVVNLIQPRIGDELKVELGRRFTEDDVKLAIFRMNPDNPGPDGFNPGFYQRYWDIVGP